jgi:hypothetical protein
MMACDGSNSCPSGHVEGRGELRHSCRTSIAPCTRDGGAEQCEQSSCCVFFHAAESVLILALWLLPVTVHAQALPTPTERHVADIASYATVGLNVWLDTKASCLEAVDRKRGCLTEVARLGTTWVAVALLKHVFPRDRPCAPSCGIDPVNEDVPSGHTAFSVAAMEGPRLAVTIPLAVSSGGLRLAAGKHDWIGVLTGAGVGALTGHFIR